MPLSLWFVEKVCHFFIIIIIIHFLKATESKKEAPAAVTAPAEAAPSTKAKEEPKPAAPPAPAAASPDNKSVGSTDNSSPSTSRKLEKRNSIQLFFKNLVK